MKKIYIIDTNVLLHDPMAIYSFAEHRVTLPMTVLEKLDIIKDRCDKDLNREARIAINNIEKILGNAAPKDIQRGVKIPSNALKNMPGTLAIFTDQRMNNDDNIPFLNANHEHANDNKIINVALNLQSTHLDATV